MTVRNATAMTVCAAALGCVTSMSGAHAQGAPFTIRKPLDGSHVREKVRIEIPRAAIGPGGFVAFYLDSNGRNGGQFMLGLAPSASEEDSSQPFTYVWDTKDAKISDGEHSIKAILYEPAAGSGTIAMTEKATTEVHVTVENKIKDGPESFLLRYKYNEGAALEYNRVGKSVIVSHDSAMGGIRSDVEMMSAKSKLSFSVEDVRYDNDAKATLALVRNKLTELSILNGGQEYTLDPTTLSNSMYQELLPEGRVHYETGATTGLAEFMAQGLPVNNTLELPLMPTLKVSKGDSWTTPGQRLDIPGIPPVLQPIVPLQNKLVDLEYEGGYPCVKIHQSFNGGLKNLLGDKFKVLPFAGMVITNPTITYDRDIYIAYNSGTLIRTARTLLIKGRTTSTVGADPSAAAGGGPGGGGITAGLSPGIGGGGGRMGPGPGGSGGMMPGKGGGKGGMMSPGGMMGPGGAGSGGMMSPGGMMGPGGGGSGGMMPGRGAGKNGGGMMGPGGGGSMGGPGFGGGGMAGAEVVDRPITIRSTTDTDLLTQTGNSASKPAAHTASMVKKSVGKGKKTK